MLEIARKAKRTFPTNFAIPRQMKIIRFCVTSLVDIPPTALLLRPNAWRSLLRWKASECTFGFSLLLPFSRNTRILFASKSLQSRAELPVIIYLLMSTSEYQWKLDVRKYPNSGFFSIFYASNGFLTHHRMTMNAKSPTAYFRTVERRVRTGWTP